MNQKNSVFPTILPRLRSPVIRKTFNMKTATSIVACVLVIILLEISIGRDFGIPKGLEPRHSVNV